MVNKKHTNEEAIKILKEAIDDIIRQKAEIETLQKKVNLVIIQSQDVQKRYENAQTEIEQWKEEANRYQKLWCIEVDDIETAKSEAIKKFADKLKDRIVNFPSVYPIENATLASLNGSSHRQLEILNIIENLVKEMIGDTE